MRPLVMPSTINSKIKAGFLLLTLIPVMLGIVIWDNTQQLGDATRELGAANELIRRLESFLSRLKDVEVAEREYVLTSDESYITEFQTARDDIESRLLRLSLLRANKLWLEHLRTLVPQKFEEIQKTIDLTRSGDVTGAQNMLLTNRGIQPMDDIRRVVRAMISEESQLLDEAAKTRDHKLMNTALLSAVMLLLNGAFIWSLFIMIRREARVAERATEELEARVQQRTLELRRSNEELQQFAYAASHDLKEPMRMIASYAALLDRRYRDQLGDDAQTWIQFITDGVRRMNQLITDLLDYSRAGQISDDEKEHVNTEDVLTAVLANLKTAIEESHAVITHDPLPRILFEPVRMEQLLQNLISNALKYRASDGHPVVHVSASEGPSETQFSVTDNGIGISPQYQDEIFGIFKRLHGKEIEGTGVGLATCKRIIEEHGGRIWVESIPGRGSTFRFTVPVAKPAAKSAVGT